MSNNNCGCNKATPASNEYLLVAATGSAAANCGAVASEDLSANCPKQEPMYDLSMSDFVMPASNGQTSMEVCNPNIYTIEMWLQFLSPKATLQITNITGKILTLINRCPNGDAITGNPSPGEAMLRSTKFVVVDAPPCATALQRQADLNEALSEATQLCVPAMVECSSTAIIHPVGRVESDPANLNVGKCIRRIYGFLFRGGTPVLSRLRRAPTPGVQNYRRLVKHKTTHEVLEVDNYMDEAGLLAARQYFLSVRKEGEKLIGPAYAFRPFLHNLVENTTSSNPLIWPAINTEITDPIDIGGVAQITELIRNGMDHYYVLVKFEFASSAGGANMLRAKINNLAVGSSYSNANSDVNFNSVTVPMRVEVSNQEITIKLNASISSRVYYNVSLAGIWF